MDKYFRVEVSDHDGQIVVIEPGMLAGRGIGPDEEETIICAIELLAGFIGNTRTPSNTAAVDRRMLDRWLVAMQHARGGEPLGLSMAQAIDEMKAALAEKGE